MCSNELTDRFEKLHCLHDRREDSFDAVELVDIRRISERIQLSLQLLLLLRKANYGLIVMSNTYLRSSEILSVLFVQIFFFFVSYQLLIDALTLCVESRVVVDRFFYLCEIILLILICNTY